MDSFSSQNAIKLSGPNLLIIHQDGCKDLCSPVRAPSMLRARSKDDRKTARGGRRFTFFSYKEKQNASLPRSALQM